MIDRPRGATEELDKQYAARAEAEARIINIRAEAAEKINAAEEEAADAKGCHRLVPRHTPDGTGGQRIAHELSVRMALGANGGRLIRQIVLEDSLLVVGGSVCALVLGRAASRILVRWASDRNSLLTFDLHPNLPLAVLGVGLMLLSLLCFSILPAFIFIRTGVARTAGAHARVAGISQTTRQRWRSGMRVPTACASAPTKN